MSGLIPLLGDAPPLFEDQVLAYQPRRATLEAGQVQILPRPRSRYVLTYWEIAGDEAAWSDGWCMSAGMCDNFAWLRWKEELQGANAHLAEQLRGLWSEDFEQLFGVVIDTRTRKMYLAPVAWAEGYVKGENGVPE